MNNKIRLAILLFLFSLQTFSQSPNWLWAKRIGSAQSYDGGACKAIDDAGNMYMCGSFSGQTDFDPGPGTYNMTAIAADIFVLKLDSANNFIWAISMGSSLADGANALALDGAGNLYISGSFQGMLVDFDPGPGYFFLTDSGDFVAKYTVNGNFVWAKQLVSPGGFNHLYEMALDTAGTGDIYITGSFNDSCDFDFGPGRSYLYTQGYDDHFVARYDPSGNLVWAKDIGGYYGSAALCLCLDPSGSGDIYTAGEFQGSCDFNPDAGTYILNANGGYDIFISKMNSSGQFVWAKSVGSTGYDRGLDILVDPTNASVYVTGAFEGTVDADPGPGIFNLTSAGQNDTYFSKFNTSGNFIWAKPIGASSYDEGRKLAVNPATGGDVYITGFFMGTADFDPGAGTFNLTSAGDYDIYLARYSSAGNFIWAKRLGGTTGDYGLGISFFSSGNLLLSGYFASQVLSLDALSLTNASNSGTTYDLFWAKLDTAIVLGSDDITITDVINIFPNPVADEFSFFNYQSSIHKIEIFSIPGEKILSQYFSAKEKEFRVNVKNFPPGIYIVKATGDKLNWAGKFVKE